LRTTDSSARGLGRQASLLRLKGQVSTAIISLALLLFENAPAFRIFSARRAPHTQSNCPLAHRTILKSKKLLQCSANFRESPTVSTQISLAAATECL
jgi:hypothetical protein